MRVSIKLQNGLPLADNVLLAQLAETRGLDGIWVSEYAERDAVTFMTVLGRATERVTIGTAIIPFYTRSDAVLGMTAAALSEAMPGRVKLGFGTSTDVIVERWHGRERTVPMRTARESFERVRQVLAGETLPGMDDSGRNGFRLLSAEHTENIELMLAALGPKMCTLAGEIADGVLLNVVSPGHVSRVRELVADGAARAGRATNAEVIADVRTAVSDDGVGLSDAREGLRKMVASYGRVPPYNRHYATSGFETQADAIRAAFDGSGGIDEATANVDDAMLDQLVAAGSADEVVERLVAYHEHGLDEVILFPTPTDGDETTAAQRIIDVGARLKERLS